MARPIKEGLDYFPLDIDVDSDDKVAMIEALHGIEGFGILIKLFMKIYKESYFYEWNKREQLLFSKRVNVDINQVNDVVNDCINEGIFHKNIYQSYGVLTSKGIQKRYLEAIKRRKEVVFKQELFLIDDVKTIIGNSNISIFLVDVNNKRINVNNNSINVNISTQRKGKEIIKEKNIINAAEFYQQNFGIIGPRIGEQLTKWIEEFEDGEEIVLYALELAIDANVLKWSYANKIIQGWFDRGVKKIEQCKALQLEFKNKKNNTKNNVYDVDPTEEIKRREETGDWLIDD